MSNPGFETHLVENQVPALVGDLLSGDTALREGLARGYLGALHFAPLRDRLSEGESVRLAPQSSAATANHVGHDK